MKNFSETDTKGEKTAPFIVSLPSDGSSYYEIIKNPPSVTMRSGLVTLKTGEEVGWHSTKNHEELIVILEGSGDVKAEGIGDFSVSKGQVVYMPPETPHNVINPNHEPLKYIFIVARA